MTRVIDGIRYLMRDQRPVASLRKLHRQFVEKYGHMDFHQWLRERGKVSMKIVQK